MTNLTITRLEALALYKMMRRIRAFEVAHYYEILKGLVPGFNHIYAGGEASAAGMIAHLDQSDWITSTHRPHGHYIAKTGEMRSIALELYGRAEGVCGGKGGHMHIANLAEGMFGANGIVGANVPHAVGLAWGSKLQLKPAIAMAFFGDGSFNQGGTLEAMNLASVYSLPVVFVLEDNGYAQSIASSWSIGGSHPVARAAGFGIPGCRVDGVDAVATWTAGRQSVEWVRSGKGPYFVHITIPLFYGHYVGDTEKYRAREKQRKSVERKIVYVFYVAICWKSVSQI